jgi:hypothetical protein
VDEWLTGRAYKGNKEVKKITTLPCENKGGDTRRVIFFQERRKAHPESPFDYPSHPVPPTLLFFGFSLLRLTFLFFPPLSIGPLSFLVATCGGNSVTPEETQLYCTRVCVLFQTAVWKWNLKKTQGLNLKKKRTQNRNSI